MGSLLSRANSGGRFLRLLFETSVRRRSVEPFGRHAGKSETERHPVDVLAVLPAEQRRRLLDRRVELLLRHPADPARGQRSAEEDVVSLGQLLTPGDRLPPFGTAFRHQRGPRTVEPGVERARFLVRGTLEATAQLDHRGVVLPALAATVGAGLVLGADQESDLHLSRVPAEDDVRGARQVPHRGGRRRFLPVDPADPDLGMNPEEWREVLGAEQRARALTYPLRALLSGAAMRADHDQSVVGDGKEGGSVRGARRANAVRELAARRAAHHAEFALAHRRDLAHPCIENISACGTPPRRLVPPGPTNPPSRASPSTRSPSRLAIVARSRAQRSSSFETRRSP